MKTTLSLRSFLLGTALLATITTAQAATLHWDGATPGGDAGGGGGTWNTASNWSTAATGGSAVAWNNTLPDAAVFGGTAGTVTLGAARTASGITINTGGYILSNSSGNVLTIGSDGITIGPGVASTVQFGTGVANTSFVTLSASQQWINNSNQAFFVRDGILDLGAHTLTFSSPGGGQIAVPSSANGAAAGSIIVGTNTFVGMSGNNNYGGTTTINSGGILTVNSFGNSNAVSGVGQKVSNLASNLVIDGGTLRVQVNSATSDRLFTVGAGGATFEANLTGANSGQILLTGSNAITYAGVGNRTFTIGGNSDDTGGSSIARAIGDVGGGNGTVALAKTGTHNWTVSGTNTFSGGTTVSAGILTMGSTTALGSTSGQLTVNTGGTLNMAANSLTVGNLTGTGGTISGTSGTRTLTIGQGDGTGGNYQGAIQNGAGGTTALTKTGTGTITLSGTNNTYTGATNVNGGTLLINGSISTSTVTVANVATLGGNNGTIGGATAVNGTLAPGTTTTGTMNFSTTLALGATSTYLFELNNTTNAADLTNVTGTLNISNSATLNLVQLGAYALGDKFTLFSYSSTLTGNFFGRTEGTEFFDADGFWKIAYADTSAGLNGGTGSRFVTITAIPEPSAALLGGLGVLCLLRRRRN